MSDPKGSQVEHENIGSTTFDHGDFWNCAQAQTGSEIFALVESI